MRFLVITSLLFSLAGAEASNCITSTVKVASLYTSKRDHYESLLNGHQSYLRDLTKKLTDNSIMRMNIEAYSEMTPLDQANLRRLHHAHDEMRSEQINALQFLVSLIVDQSLQERNLIRPVLFNDILSTIRRTNLLLVPDLKLNQIQLEIDSNFSQQRGIENYSEMTGADRERLIELEIKENELRTRYWKQMLQIVNLL